MPVVIDTSTGVEPTPTSGRQTFPNAEDRLVYTIEGASDFRPAVARLLRVYSDAGATTLADIQTLAGAAIANSELTVDGNSLLPEFKGPDGVDTLYVKPVGGSTVTRITANNDARLDALNTSLSAVVTGSGFVTQAERTADNELARDTYSRSSSSNLVSIIGDSIAGGVTGGFWARELAATSDGRVVEVRNAGVGGNNSTQMLARIQADVLSNSLLTEWVVIEGVTPNDPSQSVSIATSKTNIIGMIDAVRAAGRRPIVCLGPPSDTTAWRNHILNVNAWLVRYAELQGIPCWDLYTSVSDPVDGTFLASMTTDGTHLSVAGAKAIATDIAATQLPATMTKNLSRWVTSTDDPANLVLNGAFVGDLAPTAGDGVATFWYTSGLATRSLVARPGALGNWQSATSSAANEFLACNNISTGFAIGDLMEMTAEIQVTAGTGNFIVRPVSGATPIATSEPGANADWVFAGTTPSGVTVPVLRRFVVPTGTSTLAIRFVFAATMTALVGRVSIRNLTALGLA